MDDPNAELSRPGETRSGTSDAGLAGGAGQPGPGIPPALKKVFLGPHGVRAGWRLLLFLSIALCSGYLLGRLIRLLGLHAGGGFTPRFAFLGEGVAFSVLLFSATVMAWMEKRSMADYALPGRGAFGAWFWKGVAWGFLALTSVLFLMRVAHGFEFGSVALGGVRLISYAVSWAAAFLAVGCLEEFLFRGYALYTLATGIGFWPAAVLLSALFGAVHLHNAGETWVGGLSAALIGMFLCLTVRRSGSLWFAIGLHAMWDYSESFLYSVPDSGAMVEGHLLNSSFHGPRWLTGGSVGPEGSALVFVIIAAMLVVFDRLYPKVHFPLVVPGRPTPGSASSALALDGQE